MFTFRVHFHILLFFIVLGSTFTQQLYAYEKVIIQGVSKSRKTFVIRRGKGDNYYPDLEARFSTPLINFIARIIEVNREYSQWVILEPGGKVPFEKGHFSTAHRRGPHPR